MPHRRATSPTKLLKTWLYYSFSLLYFNFQFLASDDSLSSAYINMCLFLFPKTHCLLLILTRSRPKPLFSCLPPLRTMEQDMTALGSSIILPVPRWLTLGKFFNFLEPQFPKCSLSPQLFQNYTIMYLDFPSPLLDVQWALYSLRNYLKLFL